MSRPVKSPRIFLSVATRYLIAGAAAYCPVGSSAWYFVRTGNGTRELDVREAIVHVAQRSTEIGVPTVGAG